MALPGASRATALCLLLILGAYFIIGGQYAALTPPWQVPDEPAHYNYVRHVATTRNLPVLQNGDYNQAYLIELTSSGFPPNKPVDSLRYEGHQPPLYYLLATPIYVATEGTLLPLRLFSLTLGAGVILFAFLIARALFDDPAVALTAAGLAAFVPQHLAMMAGVNNDSLAELVIGATLWAALTGPAQGRGIERQGKEEEGRNQSAVTKGGSSREPLGPWALRLEPWNLRPKTYFVILGLLVGAAFVTKATAYVVAPVVALSIWLRAKREGWPATRLARSLAIFLVPALAIGALWWGRNLSVYGWPDVLGLDKHDAIVAGQPRTQEWIAAYGFAAFAQAFAVTTFRSFWGQFGWMGVVMDGRVYSLLLAFSLFVVAGCFLAARRNGRGKRWTQAQRDALAILSFSGLLTAALYLYYNLALVQHQGRYLFPALIPLSIWAALGLQAWAQMMGERLQTAGRRPQAVVAGRQFAVFQWLPLGTVGLLAALAVVALYRFILPGLPRF